MGIYQIRCLLYPAPFKLFRWYNFVMFHLWTCLTTFNIGEFITGRELNNCRGVSSICNSLHIELHLICGVVRALCHAMPH